MGFGSGTRHAFVFVVCLLSCGAICSAAFIDQRETFNGTTIDTTTWLAYNAAAITQNNGVTLDVYPVVNTELTTSFTVAPGQTVRAAVSVSRFNPSYSAMVGLWLSSGSAGSQPFYYDDAYMGIMWQPNGVYTNAGRYPSGGGYTVAPALNLNQTYILEIKRLTNNTAVMSVLNPGGGVVGSYNDLNVGGIFPSLPITFPNPLHVTLYAQYATAKFDYVELPEPTTALALLPLTSFLLRRPRVPRPR